MADHPSGWYLRQFEYRGTPAPTLSEGLLRCFDVLATITAPSGLYNLPCPADVLDAIELWPQVDGMSVLLTGDLATYDGSRLTELVLAAHLHRVRVSISPWLAHLDEDSDSPRYAAVLEETRHHLLDVDFTDCDREVEHECSTACVELDGEAIARATSGIINLTLHAKSADRAGRFDYHPGIDHLARRAKELEARAAASALTPKEKSWDVV